MGLNIKLLSVSLRNIRSFGEMDFSFPPMKGDLHSDLPNGMTIAAMPNGSGKTTVLNLIKSAFIGKMVKEKCVDPPCNTKCYCANSLRRRMNKNGKSFSDDTSEFTMRLKINNEHYNVSMILNHRDKEYFWKTQSKKGNEKRWNLPFEFRRIFYNNEKLIDLFIVDAETRTKIFTDSDNDLIEKSIRQFGGLETVYNLLGEPSMGQWKGGQLEEIKSKISQTTGSYLSDNEKGRIHKRDTNCIKEVRIRISENEIKLREWEKESKQMGTKISQIQSRIEKIDDEQTAKNKKSKNLRDDIEENKDLLEQQTKKLELLLINPINIFEEEWREIQDFHLKQKEDGVPGDAGREFVRKIIKDKICICDTKVTEEMEKNLKRKLPEYIDNTTSRVVKSIQDSMIESEISQLDSAKVLSGEIKDLRSKIRQDKFDYDETFGENDAGQERGLLYEEKMRLTGIKEGIDYDITWFSTQSFRWLIDEGKDEGLDSMGTVPKTPMWKEIQKCENIPLLRSIEERLEERLQKASGESTTYNGLKIMRKVVGEALLTVSEKLRNQISIDTNNIWKNSPAIAKESELLVLKIGERGITFEDRYGRPTAGSGAQTMIACYSLGAALVKRGNLKVPLVGDTPLTGLDTDVVEKWSKESYERYEQSLLLLNASEKSIFIDALGEQWLARNTNRIVIWPEKMASDGGKEMVYSDDIDLWNKLQGNSGVGGGV